MASSIFTTAWVKGAGERALKSAVQGGVAGLGLNALTAGGQPGSLPGLLHLPWGAALSGFVLMGILSVATSVLQPDFTAGSPVVVAPDASLPEQNEGDELPDEEPDDLQDIPDEEQPVEAGLGNESEPEHATG